MYDDLRFAEKGQAVELHPFIVFVAPEALHLKSHIRISEFCWILAGIRTVIGNFVHLAPFTSIAGGGFCLFEDFSAAAAGVRVITGSDLVGGEGLPSPLVPRELRAVERAYVHLERHAFLASNVVVHPGVTIGEGAVVASNSVVTRDLEPWTIHRGRPARPVRPRPSSEVKRLEQEAYLRTGVTPFDPAPLLDLRRRIVELPSARK
jgi:galactoside O-acetyltransferase